MNRDAPSVLLVHEFPGGFGGAERYLELLGDGLTGAGARVTAVIFVADGDAALGLRERLSRVAPDTRIVAGRSRPGPIRAAVEAGDPGVLHWNFVDPFAFRGATWLLLPWGRPSVITDHLPQLRHAGPHWEMTRRLANRRIRSMIVVGDAARREAERRWRRPPPLAVVPNGVPVGQGQVRSSPGCDRPVRLLFVGRLTDQKGAAQLVPDLLAMREAGIDARLRIVGEGPLAAAVRAEIDRAGVGDRVELVGFSTDPGAEMAAADVLIAPSIYEGLPFTPLEALSTGLPVVLSDIAPHRELSAGASGPGVQLVAGDDRSGWVDAVRIVAADLPSASADALFRASAHSLEQMIVRTLDVYRRCQTAGS